MLRLDAMQVIADAERFVGVELLHCPEHQEEAPWVLEARAAWGWTATKRPLTEYVERPSSACLDAIAILGAAVAERDAEQREDDA